MRQSLFRPITRHYRASGGGRKLRRGVSFRERVRGGELLLGTMITLPSGGSAEVLAKVDYGDALPALELINPALRTRLDSTAPALREPEACCIRMY